MLSRVTFFICAALLIYEGFVFYPKWEKTGTEAEISWDAVGYYWYLPSVFIYKDLKHQENKDSILNKYGGQPYFPGFKYSNGNYVLKYSSGMSLMYLPFFTAAHIFAKASGFPADGYSLPYQFAIQLGGLIISLLGLWYFRKLLLIYYSDKVAAIVIFILVFGTNYLNYAAIGNAMTHCWLFTVYVFLLLNTCYFYRQPSYKYAIRIGLLIGLATLTRPTEIISCIIPLLWGLESVSAKVIRERFAFLYQHIRKLLAALVCAILLFSVQLVYWKYVSGHWLVYSYGDQGFSWFHPHVKLYAFNYKAGWLTYSPMLIFAFIGLIPFLLKGKNKIAMLSFFLLNYYIISAWNLWDIGGRAMIQSYPVLMFPIASLTDSMLNSKYLKWVLSPFIVLFIYFNLWLTYEEHAANGILGQETTNKKYFWATVGRYHVSEDTKKLMDANEMFEGTPKNMKLLYQNNFENDTNANYTSAPIEGKRSICLSKPYTSTPVYSVPASLITGQWIRVEAALYTPDKEWNVWEMPQFIVRFTNKGEKVKETEIRVSRFIEQGERRDLYMDVEKPSAQFDTVSVFFASFNSNKELIIDNLRIYSFD